MRDLTRPQKRFPVIKIILLSLALTLCAAGIFKIFNLGNYFFKGPKAVIQLVTDTGLKSDNNRTNILLLGTGGQGHDGPDLTDTIMIASIEKDAKDVVLLSVPRDLWTPEISAKVNHIYARGQENGNQGLTSAKEKITTLFNFPIHYAIRVDFNGFIKAIDQVGGIDVFIENSFTDGRYPIAGKENELCGIEIETKIENGIKNVYYKDATGAAVLIEEDKDPFVCRYETLNFKKGQVSMDGETALKFARSRHGTNGEGSDFARSARQQKVILAFRERVLSTNTLLNPKTIIDLISTFGSTIDTDIKEDDIPLLLKLGQKINVDTIRRVVLDSGREESVLEVGEPQNYNGQFVLVPKDENWENLKAYLNSQIFNPPQASPQTEAQDQ